MPPAITDQPDALKIMYPDKIVETMIQEEKIFRPRLKRSLPPGARLSDGYEIRFGARLAASQNVAPISDGGNFPITGLPVDKQFIFKPVILAGDYDISGMQRFVGNSPKVSFNGGEVRRRPEETMSNFGKMIEQYYVGGDGSGILGYVEADGANTITVKNPHGLRLLPKRTRISIRQSAGGAVRDSIDLRTVTARDLDNRIFTYDGANQTAVANDPIYRVAESAIAGATLAAIHPNGLRGQVDNGDNYPLIHTLDRTAAGNEELKSVYLSDGGSVRPLTEQILIQANHKTRLLSEKRPSTLILPESQVEQYIEFVAPQRRWPTSGRETQGKATGYSPDQLRHDAPGVSMDFMVCYDALPGEIYGVSWDAFFMHSAVDAQWMTGEEASLHMLPGSNGASHRFAWGAYLISIENWGTDFPLAHFKIVDLRDRLNGTAAA